jgi:uncharacterized protein YndB with AHSA1/START domain
MNRLMIAFTALLIASKAQAAPRVLAAEVVVPAPVADVWAAWTTADGIATFFAPKGRVDLRVDGTYDVFFTPEGKPGQRGAEGMRIVGVEPLKRFAFTWSAPQNLPNVRAQRTIVELGFKPEGDKATRLTFTQYGWGEGEEWDKAYDYFDTAWGGIVLPRLVERFTTGPIDWRYAAMPKRLPGTMKHALAAW